MEDYYGLLGISRNASPRDIKRAFREQAKRLHPDIAGSGAEGEMRKLLAAYEVLSNQDRRYEYDRIFSRNAGFDYRRFLQEQRDDPESQAKLVFFELLHCEPDRALAVWRDQGGLKFRMEQYLDREDWMDCAFILAEELEKRRCYYDAFTLLVALVRAERERPYFRHFSGELETVLKELVRLRLKPAVDRETYAACLEALLGLGFPPKDEARWMRSLAETLAQMGRLPAARTAFREALNRDPSLAKASRLRQKLELT